MEEIIKALFNSYAYNREFSYMIELCREVLARVANRRRRVDTDDGDIIYGFLVLMWGEYGTSPRSGWILNHKDEIMSCIQDLLSGYIKLEEIENEE